jgi:AraC-like DNA-binding protein
MAMRAGSSQRVPPPRAHRTPLVDTSDVQRPVVSHAVSPQKTSPQKTSQQKSSPQKTSVEDASFAAAPDRFAAYHDLYAVGSTVSRIGDRFQAAVRGRRAAGLLLFDRQIAGAVHQREAPRVRRDDLEHVNVQVLRSGRMLAGEPGAERLLAAGDAVLFDTTRPQRTVLYDADYVTVALPRDVVEGAVPNLRALHGRVLPQRAFPALAEAVLSLARGVSGTTDVFQGGNRLIAGLLRPAGDLPAWQAGDDDEADAARRLRALLFIDAHLGRRDLDVHAVASGSGMSRSSLYRAFAPVGGVGREIVRRRVARLRSAILQSGGDARISTLVWTLGFATPSHGSRAFKAAYGLAPGQLRAEIRAPEGRFLEGRSLEDLEPDHLRDWIRVLNGSSRTS